MNPALAAIQRRRASHDISTKIIASGEVSGIVRTQDCTAIAEYAKAQHNGGYTGTSEVKHAARLPLVIVEQYCNDSGISFEEFMKNPVHVARCVKDPKNDAFRIWKGNF